MNQISKWRAVASRTKLVSRKSITQIVGLFVIVVLIVGAVKLDKEIRSGLSDPSAEPVSVPSELGSLLSMGVRNAGDFVFLNDVRLEPGPNPNLFFVSGAHGKQILVSVDNTKVAVEIAEKDAIDVQGSIRVLPSQAVLRKQWKLTRLEQQALEGSGIYIAATHIRPKGNQEGTIAAK